MDRQGCGKTASDLLGRLRFREGVVDTLHFVEPPAYFLGEPVTGLTSRMMAEGSEKAQAEGRLCGRTAFRFSQTAQSTVTGF